MADLDISCTSEDFQKNLIRDYRRSRDDGWSHCRRHNFSEESVAILEQVSQLHPGDLVEFCNKSCILYLMNDQIRSWRVCYSVWQEWFKALDVAAADGDQNDIDFGRFWAKPVRAPPSVHLDELPRFHKKLLGRVSDNLDELKDKRRQDSYLDKWHEEYSIDPLCHAFIVILDGQPPEDNNYHALVVLTGENAQLKTPISFNDVPELGEAYEPMLDTATSRRLPLKTVVRLIARWHKAQFRPVHNMRDSTWGETDSEYLPRILSEIERVGFANCFDAMRTLEKMALRKLQLQPRPTVIDTARQRNFLRVSDWIDFEPDPAILQGDLSTPLCIPEDARKKVEKRIQSVLDLWAKSDPLPSDQMIWKGKNRYRTYPVDRWALYT